jgi:hypothetical protein
MNRGSKIFFEIFFGLILLSIIHAYFVLAIEKDYTIYTEEENIPSSYDFSGLWDR